MSAPPGDGATLELIGSTVHCAGTWSLMNIEPVETRLAQLRWPRDSQIRFEMKNVTGMDTAGAWLLHRTIYELDRQGRNPQVDNLLEPGRNLLELIRQTRVVPGHVPNPHHPGAIESMGRTTVDLAREYRDFLAFIGEAAISAAWFLPRPHRFRWTVMLENLQTAGLNALPIVGLLSFLLGVVIAYQGGVQLRMYGANIYIVDLVGVSMLRELAPLMTAIIVAGRTGSAFTAQIGTMQVTDEVSALRSIGISPVEFLVLPKLIGLILALPLLTVFADVMGLAGGMLMASAMLGVNFFAFMDRLSEAVTLQTYLVGIGKAPVFAAIIAGVGCYQGFRVGGSAESVGRRTTVSVVQSIFLVITVDAAFSVAFSWLGI